MRSRRAPRSSPAASAPRRAGSFFELTGLTDVTTDMGITNEETFGPVAPLYRFKSEEDVITSGRIATERTTRGPAVDIMMPQF
jgi:acyl-CoA reductase-like NAD-dependent aldehyde dehydrogenase